MIKTDPRKAPDFSDQAGVCTLGAACKTVWPFSLAQRTGNTICHLPRLGQKTVYSSARSKAPTARLASIACLILSFLTTRTPAQEVVRVEKVIELAVIVPGVPRDEPDFRPGWLPFTAADAVHYFSTVLEMSPEKSPNGGTVFEHQHDPLPEDRWRIEVLAEEKNVIVEFTVGGNYGIGLAREFFESPLFHRDEFETFYEMLNNAKNAPVEKMRRFTVKMTLRIVNQSQILTLRFSPRDDVATVSRLLP
jgi:hypothetical protein